MELKDKKILFIDLDGTLIKTVSGKTFPEDISDFRIRLEVLDKIVERLPSLEFFFIVSNQGGIGQYLSEDDFEVKLSAIMSFIRLYCFNKHQLVIMNSEYCISNDKNNIKRKPNTGMLTTCLKLYNLENRGKECMLMIGDASGKEGNFSDSDKKCAENFGIDYIDIGDFVNG